MSNTHCKPRFRISPNKMYGEPCFMLEIKDYWGWHYYSSGTKQAMLGLVKHLSVEAEYYGEDGQRI